MGMSFPLQPFFFFSPYIPKEGRLDFFLIHPKETTVTTTAIIYIYLKKKPKTFLAIL